MNVRNRPAFTIIELLVVVSIIALLVGILLPAISQARNQAKFTRSVANLRNLGTAHAAYASSYGDRQVTFVVDEIAHYGTNACTAFQEYHDLYGPVHTNLILGWGPDNRTYDRRVQKKATP